MTTDTGCAVGSWGPAPSHLCLPPQTLKTLRQAEVINFGDCLVRSKGAVAIAEAVRGGLPKLKVPPVFPHSSRLPPLSMCYRGCRGCAGL